MSPVATEFFAVPHPIEPNIDPLLNTAGLSNYLNVPMSWIYNNKHLLPGFRVGKEMRYRRSEIDQWLETRREGQVAR